MAGGGRSGSRRRSIRIFLPYRPVEREKVQKMLEAARRSSCAGNVMNVRAVVIWRDEASKELIDRRIFPHFRGNRYSELSDATAFDLRGEGLFTTDTYVVDPPVFPGGDIGRLAVLGTCNDLAVSGGRPVHLTVGLVLEEGFPLKVLDTVFQLLLVLQDLLPQIIKILPKPLAFGFFKLDID